MRKISIFLIVFLLISQLVACEARINDRNPGINNNPINNEADTNELNMPSISDDQNDDSVISEADVSESSTSNQNAENVGGRDLCKHIVMNREVDIDNSYHTIPGTLIEYVGQDEFSKWVEKKTEDMLTSNEGKYDSCLVFSIVDFIVDFNIPRHDFEIINDNFLADYYDYNIDVIYAGKEAAEAYYSSERLQMILEKRVIRQLKVQLKLYVENQDAAAVQNWIKEKNATEWGFSEATRSHIDIPGCGYSDEFRGGYSQYSIKEFIDYFDIPRDVVEEIYLRCQKHPAFEGELDIEALFSTESSDSGSNDSDRTDKNPLAVDRSYIVYKADNSAE